MTVIATTERRRWQTSMVSKPGGHTARPQVCRVRRSEWCGQQQEQRLQVAAVQRGQRLQVAAGQRGLAGLAGLREERAQAQQAAHKAQRGAQERVAGGWVQEGVWGRAAPGSQPGPGPQAGLARVQGLLRRRPHPRQGRGEGAEPGVQRVSHGGQAAQLSAQRAGARARRATQPPPQISLMGMVGGRDRGGE